MKTQPFTPDLAPAVAEFNARLLAGGADPELLFPENPAPEGRPNEPGRLFEERFLMVEEGSVHGGFILKHQDFWLGGTVASIAHFRLPLSEGIVNRKFAGVGMQMVRHALGEQPLLFALGMGGRQRTLPRLLEAMHWKLWEVPFYFFVNRPFRFLRGIRVLRSDAWRSLALDAAAWSGLGWVVARMAQWVARKGGAGRGNAGEYSGLFELDDELWDHCKPHYSFLAVRDSATLKLLYPEGSERFLCRRVRRSGKAVGWFVALDTAMQGHKQFGNLRVGTVADALARPEDAANGDPRGRRILARTGRRPDRLQPDAPGLGCGVAGRRFFPSAVHLRAGGLAQTHRILRGRARHSHQSGRRGWADPFVKRTGCEGTLMPVKKPYGIGDGGEGAS